MCLEVCVFALTQVEDFMLWLSSGCQCVCSCRHGRLAQQQRQQQRQESEQRGSRHGHRLLQNHRPAHVPCFLYHTHTYIHRCTHTHNTQRQHTSRDNEPCHNKGPNAGSFSSSFEFPLQLRKRGVLGSPISTFTYT